MSLRKPVATSMFDEFERWYEVSEYRVQAEMHNVFTAMDTNNDGRVGEEEFKEAMSNWTAKPD